MVPYTATGGKCRYAIAVLLISLEIKGVCNDTGHTSGWCNPLDTLSNHNLHPKPLVVGNFIYLFNMKFVQQYAVNIQKKEKIEKARKMHTI